MKSIEYPKSIEFLSSEFRKLNVHILDKDKGSITPRTIDKKAILDEVKISKEAIEVYQIYLEKKVKESTDKLNDDFNKGKAEEEYLQALVKINDTKYKKSLEEVKKNNELVSTQSKNLENSIQKIEAFEPFGFETIYQENIAKAEVLSSNTPAILRYGLDTESKTLRSLVGNYIEKGVLHPCEEELFNKALEYLEKTESATNYLQREEINKSYPNNVVLVDIFDRSSGFINKGQNQTHTIALWKKKDDEIVLIDPSNIDYSKHLLEPIKSICKTKITTLNYKILYGTATYKGNEITGYSEYDDNKPKPRDCVDIAVKVALELNEQQKLKISLEVQENKMLEQISNDSKYAKHLTKLSFIVIRELQSTNFTARNDAKRTIDIVNESIQKSQIQGLQVNKIKNYQDIRKLETAVSIIKNFC